MRRVALIRRRDGEIVPFDEVSVVEAVHRALQAAGREDRLLASEIASVVTLFLEKTYYDEVPTVEQVEDMVERVLVETGHAGAAKAFILNRARETRLREADALRSAPAEPTLFEARAIVVDDPARGTSGVFSREALARLLCADGSVSRARADDAAAAAESRLRRLGVSRVSQSWLRSVAEVELLEQGARLDVRGRPGVLLDPETIGAAFHSRGGPDSPPLPAASARELGAAAMRAHSLGEILPADVASAHLDGDLHVHCLDQPSALLSVTFSPDDVKRGLTPGAPLRAPEDAALNGRRLSAALGRGVRVISSAAGTASLTGVAAAYGAIVGRGDAVAEEAWQFLFETATDGPGATLAPGARVEADLTPLATTRDGDGAAAAFASAVLRTIARPNGLPPRECCVLPSITVSEQVLATEAGRESLRLAAECVLRGDRVIFPLSRAPAGADTADQTAVERHARGSSVARGLPGTGPSCCAGRVTLNLVRAAQSAGRGRIEPFLRSCDRLVELGATAHRTRRELLAQGGAAPGGSLAPLFRGPRGRDALLRLGGATWSFGVTGLNEALLHLTGFELHEGDDAVVRTAQRVLAYLALRVREAGLASDMACTLDADEDRDVARRFFHLDLRSDPARTANVLPEPGYTPGIGCRTAAPIDTLLRLEREDPLHANLTTATVRIPLTAAQAGGPDGIVALLGKCLRAGRAIQVECGSW